MSNFYQPRTSGCYRNAYGEKITVHQQPEESLADFNERLRRLQQGVVHTLDLSNWAQSDEPPEGMREAVEEIKENTPWCGHFQEVLGKYVEEASERDIRRAFDRAPLFEAADFLDDELRISVAVDCGVIAVAVAREGKPTVMHVEQAPGSTLRGGDLRRKIRKQAEEITRLHALVNLARGQRDRALEPLWDAEDQAQAWRAAALQFVGEGRWAKAQERYEAALRDIREAREKGK